MSSPTGADTCHHCGTRPARRWIKPVPPAVQAVELGLCDCDFMRCPHPACRKVMRGLPMNAHTCPHCNGRL